MGKTTSPESAEALPLGSTVGETCYLKSGSPRMTVIEAADEQGRVLVAWCKYDSGEMQDALLPAAALRKNWN